MLESKFQAEVISDLSQRFPGCIVLKNDANYIQGFPDLLVLFNNNWAALEVKNTNKARRQPNQDYYVGVLDEMSFAAYIHPDNKEDIFDDLQQAFRPRRASRVSKR
jgi:hypothetical protein